MILETAAQSADVQYYGQIAFFLFGLFSLITLALVFCVEGGGDANEGGNSSPKSETKTVHQLTPAFLEEKLKEQSTPVGKHTGDHHHHHHPHHSHQVQQQQQESPRLPVTPGPQATEAATPKHLHFKSAQSKIEVTFTDEPVFKTETFHMDSNSSVKSLGGGVP